MFIRTEEYLSFLCFTCHYLYDCGLYALTLRLTARKLRELQTESFKYYTFEHSKKLGPDLFSLKETFRNSFEKLPATYRPAEVGRRVVSDRMSD